jgi:hypothetical protein
MSRLSDPNENRRRYLKRGYGLTPEKYEALRVSQGYRCGVCGRHEDDIEPNRSGRPRQDGSRTVSALLVVDHCHDGGQIRGLLCNACNCGLGYFQDDPERLEAAVAYLRAAPPPPEPAVPLFEMGEL